MRWCRELPKGQLPSIADDIWITVVILYNFEHFQNSEERAFSDYGIMTCERKIINIRGNDGISLRRGHKVKGFLIQLL